MLGTESTISKQDMTDVGKALGRIPEGVFMMTARHDQRISGVLVSWVQQVAFEPPSVVVALRKGRPIVPLLQESHGFVLNQIAQEDKLTQKKAEAGDWTEEMFNTIPTFRAVTGAPILRRALAYLDCEIVRHVDFDADHDLYIGQIVAGGLLNLGQPIMRLRESGMSY